MNGYEMSANVYREYLTENNPTGRARADIEHKIKALDIMASTDRETQHEMFNSTAFNSIAKGYFLMALDRAKTGQKKKADIMREVGYLLDTVTADQAESYFMKH